MCWKSKTAISIIADKDIECSKVVLQDESNTIYSFYEEFEYKLDKLYKTKLELIKDVNNTFNVILQGFHSYSDKIKYDINSNHNNAIRVYKARNNIRIDLPNIYGIHSYILRGDKPAKSVIANCVIPKGSTYYINENEEIVSNQLIVKSIKEI